MSLVANLRRIGGAAVITVAFSAASQAAIVTLEGDNLSFSFDDATLFGAAHVVGDSLLFSPTSFLVESLNGDGYASALASLNIQVEAKGDQQIVGLHLMERGNYRLAGDGSTVSLEGRLQATSLTELDGFFPYMASTEFAGEVGAGSGGGLSPWGVTTSLSLADTAGWEGDTAVEVLIQNLLGATTDSGPGQAFGQKTYVALGVELSDAEIPLPAAGWLFGAALAGLMARSRRRS